MAAVKTIYTCAHLICEDILSFEQTEIFQYWCLPFRCVASNHVGSPVAMPASRSSDSFQNELLCCNRWCLNTEEREKVEKKNR